MDLINLCNFSTYIFYCLRVFAERVIVLIVSGARYSDRTRPLSTWVYIHRTGSSRELYAGEHGQCCYHQRYHSLA